MKIDWKLGLEGGAVLVGILGLAAIWLQMNQTNRIAKATFILELSERASSFSDTYGKLSPGGEWSPESQAKQIDATNVRTYLTFYSQLNFLIENDMLDLGTANDLFAGRFFFAVHNPRVQDVSTHDKDVGEFFVGVNKLHASLRKYRKDRGLEIPYEQYCRLFRQTDHQHSTRLRQ